MEFKLNPNKKALDFMNSQIIVFDKKYVLILEDMDEHKWITDYTVFENNLHQIKLDEDGDYDFDEFDIGDVLAFGTCYLQDPTIGEVIKYINQHSHVELYLDETKAVAFRNECIMENYLDFLESWRNW